jgi:putative addiction module killer protein
LGCTQWTNPILSIVAIVASNPGDFGQVYFGKEGEQIVILLGGGTKQRQQNDIKLALERWEDYKQRKKRQKEKEGE